MARLVLPAAVVILTALAPTSLYSQEPAASAVPTAIFDYMKKAEPAFGWQKLGNANTQAGRRIVLQVTSQTWQGIDWKHLVTVYEPAEAVTSNHVLLFVTGGRNDRSNPSSHDSVGFALARMCGAYVAILHQVPNQPLFDNRFEDDLITETWLRYLDSGDTNWPLLFPMVKSAVKTMDALEQFAQQQLNRELQGFVITGASKRGWTSWLTPVVDQRIVATAPLVIDVLNFRKQMDHQRETWGKYSEQIDDYTRKGLVVEGQEKPREAQLRQMMDPFTYRAQLTLPKLLVNGTNDRYWVVDAMSLYWDDLSGPKYCLQVPNVGHSLEGGLELVMSTIAAFFRHTTSNRPLPGIDWQHVDEQQSYGLRVTTSVPPKAARLWYASAPTKDFREARWQSRELVAEDSVWTGQIGRPQAGYVAYFGELQYEIDGVPYSLTTLIRRP